MTNFDNQLIDYIKSKRTKLLKQQKNSFILNNLIKWVLIILNLTIIALAVSVIVLETNRYNSIPLSKRGGFIEELGLTVVLASFIVLTFVFTLFLAVYTQIMQFKNYKKAIREIIYITHKAEEDSSYSKENFEKDLNEIKEFYLNKPKVSKMKLFWKALLKGGK